MKQGRKSIAWMAVICAVAVLIGGCGGDDEGGKTPQGSPSSQNTSAGTVTQTPAQPQASVQPPAGTDTTTGGAPSPTDMATMAAQTRENLAQMNQGKDIQAVTTDSLKGLLPETLAGMKRTDASAEHNEMMGMNMTKAEGQYEGENDASLSLTITDVGNMSGPVKMGMAGWTMAQYNRQTDTGYEKTTTYDGYKGLEEYNTQDKSGTIHVFVADRFIIELDGSNMTIDTMKQALSQLDLKKIASLASGS